MAVVGNKNYQSLEEIIEIVLLLRLKRFNYNRTYTAKSLGMSVKWLRLAIQKLKKQGIDIPSNPIESYKYGKHLVNTTIH